MTIIAYDPFVAPQRAVELQARLLPIEQPLAEADIIALHVALADETRHLLNAQRLRLMQPTAFLVNTARGELVDELALVAAVKEKRIAGAAIDVFAEEPLP